MNTMNINQLNAVQNTNCDWLFEVEDAESLLRHCWNRYFATTEQKSANIHENELEEIGLILRLCCDKIWDAVLEYRLMVGEDGNGVEQFFKRAADYQDVRELNRLNNASWDKERELTGAERDAFSARRSAISEMPPAVAVKALRRLLGGGEKNCV